MTDSNQFNFSAEDKTLNDILFSNLKYKIPRYQRPYAWGEDNISDFWNDLYSTPSYFIGSLVLNYELFENKGFIEIIDGQQRVLTITIFMAVIRDIAKELEAHKLADRIQRQCISFEDKRGKETFKIECGDSTKLFFEKRIQEYENTFDNIEVKKLTKEEKLIKNNYNFLKTKVLDELKKYTNKKDQLNYIQNLWDRIGKISVIQIKIENEEDAYEIFETVNARGVDLTVADLLKNLVFKEIKPIDEKEKDKIKQKWTEINNNVKETGIELTKFIRYFWLSKFSFTTEKKLFKAIKKEISDYEKFLDELLKGSEQFKNLIAGDLETWTKMKNGNKIFTSLQNIKIMGVSQCYVLLLCILRNYDKLGTNPKRIFELIENFTFNYSTVCSLPGNKVEKIYAKNSLLIENAIKTSISPKSIAKEIQTIFHDLEKELRELKPPFDYFKDNFAKLTYKKSEKMRKLIKYILSKMDSQNETGEYMLDFSTISIEHILPQSPLKEWKLTKSDVKEYVNKLGNLILVHKVINSKAGNKNIKNKIKELSESKIPMTKNLIKKIETSGYNWSKAEIETRHQQLAKKAYDFIWNY